MAVGTPVARAADVTSWNFRQPIPAVGKIFRQDSTEGGGNPVGHCSGTLISSGILVTAAHCLYNNDETAAEKNALSTTPGYLQDQLKLYFAPDESASGNGSTDWQDTGAPYGALQIVNSWVPQCWADAAHGGTNDGGCDYGLAEIAPGSDGSYAGQHTGAFPLLWNYVSAAGASFYLMGYPAQGLYDSLGQCTAGFCLPKYDFGDSPVYCADTFSGNYDTSQNDPGDASLLGSGYYLGAPGCGMTGGASGGPVFTQYSGHWYINGVNNIGAQDPSSGFGDSMSWNWWGSGFGNFVCGIVPNECSQ